VTGAVDGGGLLVVLAPPLEKWPDRVDGFDRTLAVAPYDPDDVGGRFRERVVDCLAHPGVAVYDADDGVVERPGLTDPAPALDRSDERASVGPDGEPAAPAESVGPDAPAFPDALYRLARTRDQAAALARLERLRPGDASPESGDDGSDDPRAVVLAADRGRGKSAVAGLAAGALAAEGHAVLVTAPEFRNAAELLRWARRALATLGRLDGSGAETEADDPPRTVRATTGSSDGAAGSVRYHDPGTAPEWAGEADVVLVDEAAALPVERLSAALAADRVAFATTVRGYEGAGRGFSVRFRDRLAESDHAVTDVEPTTPIRYAASDPVESWAFRTLALDARPPVEAVVADARPDTVTYRALSPADLADDEYLLRETFGLLVLAHYRTEPDDLARLLDAPNVLVRALVHDGHVVSVALLAREGGLDADTRARAYEGERIRGHMLPDVLVSQLRDEAAGVPTGLRVMRIATHGAVRSRGLGSHLLARVRAEFGAGEATDRADAGPDRSVRAPASAEPVPRSVPRPVDWLGVGYGATPRLVAFWRSNGFRAVQLSVTRNDRSGEHSALMLRGLTDRGRALADRHAGWLADRLPAMATDALREVDPDVVRATLRATGVDPSDGDRLALSEPEWRLLAGAAHGPGLYAVDPRPFRRLAVAGLLDSDRPLEDRQERLLVALLVQSRPADRVAEALDYHSRGACLRAVGDALAVLVDRYGPAVAREERDRYG
jgi:tRNA(Met) cytidine acetyltransferase